MKILGVSLNNTFIKYKNYSLLQPRVLLIKYLEPRFLSSADSVSTEEIVIFFNIIKHNDIYYAIVLTKNKIQYIWLTSLSKENLELRFEEFFKNC